MFDKRYLKLDFIWQRLRKGPRMTWNRLSQEDRDWITNRARELNLQMSQTKQGTRFMRTLDGQGVEGHVEYVVDFGWKKEPDTPRLLIDAIDKQIFDDTMKQNPALLLALMARDSDTLQQEIGFTEFSHIYTSLNTGRPKTELN